jgi:hypothetical protein
MNNPNDSYVTLTQNNSLMDTKASFGDDSSNEISFLLEEYDRITRSFDDIDNE